MWRRTTRFWLPLVLCFTALGIVAPAEAEASDEFDTLRERWRASLDGGPDLDPNDPDIARKVADITQTAQGHWETMDTTPDTYVWSDLHDVSANGSAIDGTYRRLRDMALAFSTKGSPLYHDETLRDDLIVALDWVHANWYNASTEPRGNWWEWYIGAPNRLKDIVVILYPHLTEAQIQNYTAAIDHFLPSDIATWKGANASDVLLHHLVSGILQKDSAQIAYVRELLPPLLESVTSGVGFYEDGSYIDHVAVPYNLSYGKEYLNSLSNIVYLLSGSSWTLDDPDMERFCDIIYAGYEPLIYKGAGMDMVRGRAIGRELEQDHYTGHAVIASLAGLSTVAPPEHAAAFAAMIKHWIGSDTYQNLYQEDNQRITPFVVTTVKSIMNDDSVRSRPELIGHYAYNSMDRTVHRARGFAFAVSKSSKRIQNYEQMNNENAKAWYTADGMTYLYNADLGQYSGNFWPTVDMRRLPGTTTEVRQRFRGNPEGHVQDGDGEGRPTNAWSGGSTLGDYGASGMHLRPTGGTSGGSLSAHKSWFMFDDEVVALGSDIKTTTPRGREVETVVENRKLNAAGTNTLTVDGKTKRKKPGWSERMSGVSWIHLQGSTKGSDIGYYFPEKADIEGLRETRTGKWSDLTANGQGGETHTNHFMTLILGHGVDPTAARYGYVLLPNRRAGETNHYAKDPDVSILANTAAVHAVRENTLGVTGYNFWTDTPTKAGEVSSTKQASVMTRKVGRTLEISVNDPTMENTGTIDLEISERALEVVDKDPRITVVGLSPSIELSVDVSGARGKSFTATFRLAP